MRLALFFVFYSEEEEVLKFDDQRVVLRRFTVLLDSSKSGSDIR